MRVSKVQAVSGKNREMVGASGLRTEVLVEVQESSISARRASIGRKHKVDFMVGFADDYACISITHPPVESYRKKSKE